MFLFSSMKCGLGPLGTIYAFLLIGVRSQLNRVPCASAAVGLEKTLQLFVQ